MEIGSRRKTISDRLDPFWTGSADNHLTTKIGAVWRLREGLSLVPHLCQKSANEEKDFPEWRQDWRRASSGARTNLPSTPHAGESTREPITRSRMVSRG